MTREQRAWSAVSALAAIVAITTCWWALALWPVNPSTPAWLLRTRVVCFGPMVNDLPNAGGWLLLIGQPIGMLTVLVTVWTAELRAGLALTLRSVVGQVMTGLLAATMVAGLAGVGARVSGWSAGSFSGGPEREIVSALTRVNDEAPAFALADQRGQTISLDRFRGRPVLVTFAYGHCETVCPMVVADVLSAQQQVRDRSPAVVIITLDPWRDTPNRLESIASAWHMGAETHLLSGAPAVVERALNAWRVPRVRNERTGDLSHPSMVYVIGPDGRIGYVVQGNAQAIAAAVRAL
jgi:cytochrome oxidase Cu insertion factor (SCO1/SenC/PrrC family)